MSLAHRLCALRKGWGLPTDRARECMSNVGIRSCTIGCSAPAILPLKRATVYIGYSSADKLLAAADGGGTKFRYRHGLHCFMLDSRARTILCTDTQRSESHSMSMSSFYLQLETELSIAFTHTLTRGNGRHVSVQIVTLSSMPRAAPAAAREIGQWRNLLYRYYDTPLVALLYATRSAVTKTLYQRRCLCIYNAPGWIVR